MSTNTIRLATAAAVLLFWCSGVAAGEGLISSKVIGVGVIDVSPLRITFSVTIQLKAHRDVVLENLAFRSFNLNDLPLFLPPVNEKTVLHSENNKDVTIAVTAYYRDMTSLRPLIIGVQTGKAVIRRDIRALLKLGTLAALVTGSCSIPVETSFEGACPMVLPGGMIGRDSVVAVLGASDKILLKVKGALSDFEGDGSGPDMLARKKYGGALLLAAAQYRIRNAEGQVESFRVFRAGTRVSADKFILPDEVLEPWRFDPQVSARLFYRGWTLVSDVPEVLVWPSGAAFDGQWPSGSFSGYRLGPQGFKVLARLGQRETKVLTQDSKKKTHSTKRLIRGDSHNVALFQFDGAVPALPSMEFTLSDAPANFGLIFRTIDSWYGGAVAADLVPTSVTLREAGLVEIDPVDASAWGAPIVCSSGLMGLVLDERVGLTVDQAMKLLTKNTLP